jgi:hypothetical protein
MASVEKAKSIIIDLDGTLCDCTHRRHFLDEKRPDWRSFNESMREDGLNSWCLDLIHAMGNAGFKILLVSGRGDDFRDATVDWLQKYAVPYDLLAMRPAKDNRKDSLVKFELYQKLIEPQYDVHFVVDDRKQVVDMWRELGLTCLQCAEGNY